MISGNSWGVDKLGRGCVGCGPQEQFYGCADIAIGSAVLPDHVTLPYWREDPRYQTTPNMDIFNRLTITKNPPKKSSSARTLRTITSEKVTLFMFMIMIYALHIL